MELSVESSSRNAAKDAMLSVPASRERSRGRTTTSLVGRCARRTTKNSDLNSFIYILMKAVSQI